VIWQARGSSDAPTLQRGYGFIAFHLGRDHVSAANEHHCTSTKVRSIIVVVAHVFCQESLEMPLVQDDYVV
jgi:hypothetical protein